MNRYFIFILLNLFSIFSCNSETFSQENFQFLKQLDSNIYFGANQIIQENEHFETNLGQRIIKTHLDDLSSENSEKILQIKNKLLLFSQVNRDLIVDYINFAWDKKGSEVTIPISLEQKFNELYTEYPELIKIFGTTKIGMTDFLSLSKYYSQNYEENFEIIDLYDALWIDYIWEYYSYIGEYPKENWMTTTENELLRVISILKESDFWILESNIKYVIVIPFRDEINNPIGELAFIFYKFSCIDSLRDLLE